MQFILTYILNEERLDYWFYALIWVTPIASILLYPVFRFVLRDRHRVMGALLLTILTGPVVTALWHIYNGIIHHFGLDSVNGFLLNLLLFAVSGIAIGLLLVRLQRSR